MLEVRLMHSKDQNGYCPFRKKKEISEDKESLVKISNTYSNIQSS